ncbi:MAG: Hsp70 family protein, partial [Lachnospiraceae bacterium]|nr:Hsp70 family protein [Lachnospiraceae bacterium]
IDRAVKEAQQYEAEDRKRKEGVDARNEADSMVFQVEDALKNAGDKLDPADKAAVESDLQALKDILAKHTDPSAVISEADVAEIKSAKDKLLESAQKLFARMYEQTQQGGQAGPNAGGFGGQASGGNDDDVVDADYTEV